MDFIKEQQIIEFLREDPLMISTFDQSLLTSRIWKRCLEWVPTLFEEMPDRFNSELAEYAVKLDGKNLLLYEPKGLSPTRELLMLAMQTFPSIILYVDSDSLTNDLLEMACRLDNSLINTLPVTDEFIISMIRERPFIIRNIEHQTSEQMLEAIDSSSTIDIRLCLNNPSKKIMRALKRKFG